jgi:hypothetical protein
MDNSDCESVQKLEELVAKTQQALEQEEKVRKEVEAQNQKLIQERMDLMKNLEGEKGSLSSIQERNAKLMAQKSDLETQLMVSHTILYYFHNFPLTQILNPIVSLLFSTLLEQ